MCQPKRMPLLSAVVILVMIFYLLPACGKSNTAGYTAGLVAGNWVVNGKNFNLRFDDEQIGKDSLAFNDVSIATTGLYTEVGAGLHRLTITSGSETLLNNVFNLAAGSRYSLLLFDTLQNSSLNMLLLKDEVVAVDTLVKARFFQMIPSADSVTLRLKNNSAGYYRTDLYIGRHLSPVTGSFPLSLPPATYSISLSRKNAAGVDQQVGDAISAVLVAGKVYSFLATGTGTVQARVKVMQHN